MLRFAALIAVALMLVPSLVAAQATEPVGTVSEDDTSVSRSYEGSGADGIFGIFALGNIADMESQAVGMMTTLPAVLASGMSGSIEESGATVGAPEQVPVTPIGDQSSVTRVPYTMMGSVEGELVILAVRQDSWVQLLMAIGLGEVDLLSQLEGLAREVLPRWPAADAVTVRPDGIRTGGIWTMMPLPEDMPAGYTLDPDIEEGPATSETPDSDLPLLPTPAPAGETPPAPETPTVASGPAESAPTAQVATPAPNPRLALPFDVTVEVFLPLDLATIEDDGSCRGSGLLDGLGGDGQIALHDARGGDASASAPLTAPGQVALDRETGEEVCYFRATLTDVPARAAYTLLAGETVLGRYTYDDLTETGSILVVIGEDGP